MPGLGPGRPQGEEGTSGPSRAQRGQTAPSIPLRFLGIDSRGLEPVSVYPRRELKTHSEGHRSGGGGLSRDHPFLGNGQPADLSSRLRVFCSKQMKHAISALPALPSRVWGCLLCSCRLRPETSLGSLNTVPCHPAQGSAISNSAWPGDPWP